MFYRCQPGFPDRTMEYAPMTQYIVSSGITSGITVGSGSTMSVFDTGVAQDITVTNGGSVIAYDGGVTSGTVLSTIAHQSGGMAVEDVNSGGTSVDAAAERKSKLVVSGGTTDGTLLDKQSTETVYAGGTAINTTVEFSSDLVVSNATATGTVLGKEGMMTVSSGGVAIDTVVSAFRGFEVVLSGGITSDTLVSASSEYLEGGRSSGTVLEGGRSYGFQIVSAGTAHGTVVDLYGYQQVTGLQAQAIDTVVHSGGQVFVSAGGTVKNCRIRGGKLVVASGSVTSGNVKFVGSGGTFEIGSQDLPSATISGFAPGDQIILDDSFNGSGTVTVNTPGVVTISAGGSEYNLNIAGATVGETDFVFSAETLTKTAAPQTAAITPDTAPPPIIVSSGTTSGITVSSGSVMSVLDTGIAKDIMVTSGGVISAFNGGVTSGVVLSTNPFSAVSMPWNMSIPAAPPIRPWYMVVPRWYLAARLMAPSSSIAAP